jgi:hypothetical protein
MRAFCLLRSNKMRHKLPLTLIFVSATLRSFEATHRLLECRHYREKTYA